MPDSPTLGYGLFIPTTDVYDTSILESIDVTQPEFKELLVKLYQNLNVMALAVNLKDSGYYIRQEFVNGQLYFENPAYNSSTAITPTFRQVNRMTINFGTLPNATTISVPHNIDPNTGFTFTRIYATASDPVNREYVPIPYASNVANDSIEINVDATNVNITTASDWTAYTVTYVVLEYLKN